MCIIAIKRKGIAMPDNTAITNMWNNNRDGAGIMYTKDNKVFIEKGFMDFKKFRARLDKLENEINTKKEAVVLHFRIGTAGGNVPANTHPFPISDVIPELQKLKLVTSIGVAHNGIIDVTPRQKDISDTMEYIASQLAPLYRACPQFYKNEDLMTLVGNAITSKMAFLTSGGQIYTIGAFITDEKSGMVYSNTSYSYSTKYRSVYSYAWDDAYDYGDWYTSKWSKQKKEDDKLPMSYTYTTDLLMPLPEGGFIEDKSNREQYTNGMDADFWVDKEGAIYVYDRELMAVHPLDGIFFAYNPSGSLLNWELEKSEKITISHVWWSIDIAVARYWEGFYYEGSAYPTDDETGGDTFLSGDVTLG